MTDTDVIHLASQAITMIGKLSAPLLLVSLAIGIVISLVQTVLSLQDQTLSQVPRLAVVGVALLVGAPWIIRRFATYTIGLLGDLHRFSQ